MRIVYNVCVVLCLVAAILIAEERAVLGIYAVLFELWAMQEKK